MEPTDSPGQSPAEPNPSPKRSHRTAWIIGGVVVAVLAIVVVVVIVVVNGSRSSTSSHGGTQSAPAEPPGGYDISRIAALANDFPPGYTVTPIPRTVLTQKMVDDANGFVGAGKPLFDPPQCAMQHRGNLVEGAVMQGVTAHGPTGLPGRALPQFVMVLATHTEQPIHASKPAPGCDHVSVTMDGANGTDERVSGPTITGVPTEGVKTHWVSAPITGQPEDTYIYIALLSNKTLIQVTGKNDPQLLQDLLVKAVSAIRGQ